MENETEPVVSPTNETDEQELVIADDSSDEDLDATALKEKLTQSEDANRQLFERAKKAEGFVKLDGKWVKGAKPEPKPKVVEPKAKTGELDENVLDYLDLKGITEQEDIDVIESVMKRTGQTVRELLKDEYVAQKLKTNQEKRAVQKATPSGTKRAGGEFDGLDAAIAKFEKTGELPSDFALKTKVVNAVVERENKNKPSWH